MAKGYEGNYKGRSDYGGKKGGSVDTPVTAGNKGIPSGLVQPQKATSTKGVETVVDAGNKGIPSGVSSKSSQAPLD